MSEWRIEVQKRDEKGKNQNRRLRSQGIVPAVVYGDGREPVPVRVDCKSMLNLFRAGAGENTVFLLNLSNSGQERHAMIRDLQYNPLNGELLHIDFLRIKMTESVRVKVPVQLVGTPFGVKTESGMLDFITRELEVECLPAHIPQSLDADVSGLHIGQHVDGHDLDLPDGVALVDADRVIAAVAHLRAVEAVAEEAEAPEALLEADKEEPEVIRRGKGEEEEG